jgi:hypothetical protein
VCVQLTLATIRGDEASVVLQAIEFWCTICEEEYDLLEEIGGTSLLLLLLLHALSF